MYIFDSYSPAWAILGGFGLFLFGIRYLSEILQRVAGARFKRVLDSCVRNRLTSLLVGGLLTAMLQSETIAAIMAVTFVNSGLFSLYQALAVLLGTTLGTTVAMQLAVVLATPVTFSLILFGVAAKYFSRNRRVVAGGELLLGLGFIFLGLGIMESGFSAITTRLAASGILNALGSSPFIAFLVGTLITVLLQSGRASLAVIATLAHTRVIGPETAFAMLAGELLGAPIMALVATLLGTPMSRMAAGLFFGFNFVIAAIVLYFSPGFILLSGSLTNEITGQLVMAHAMASMLGAVIFIPLLGVTVRWAATLGGKRKNAIDVDPRPKFIDRRILTTPGIALSQARDEVLRMATVSRAMLKDLDALLYRYDSKKITNIHQQEEVMDLLQRDITEFLALLSPALSDVQGRYEVTRLLSTVNNLELAGDSIALFLKVLVKKKEQRVQFSPAAMNDLKMLLATIGEFFDLMLANWQELSEVPAMIIHDHQQAVGQLAEEAMELHLERLAEGKCSVQGALIYNDLLEACGRLCSSISKVFTLNRDGVT